MNVNYIYIYLFSLGDINDIQEIQHLSSNIYWTACLQIYRQQRISGICRHGNGRFCPKYQTDILMVIMCIQFDHLVHMSLKEEICNYSNYQNLHGHTQKLMRLLPLWFAVHYWPFVRGIHRSPVDSPHKGPVKYFYFSDPKHLMLLQLQIFLWNINPPDFYISIFFFWFPLPHAICCGSFPSGASPIRVFPEGAKTNTGVHQPTAPPGNTMLGYHTTGNMRFQVSNTGMILWMRPAMRDDITL